MEVFQKIHKKKLLRTVTLNMISCNDDLGLLMLVIFIDLKVHFCRSEGSILLNPFSVNPPTRCLINYMFEIFENWAF